ncbi:MAG: helix-hairpin-helix domain-containing protein [Halopenitus sp.]
MDGETLPGADAGEDGVDRVILHVDMDCFYASCERLREPELEGEPLVVGMGYQPGQTIGAVATASYEAREFGVDSAQPISQALENLPRRANADPDDPDAPDPSESGHYRPVDMEYYKSVAADVKEVLHDCADTVREVSVDEAYLDVMARTAWDVAGDVDLDEANGAAERTDEPPEAAESAAAGPATYRRLAEGYARYVRDRIERQAGVPASVGVAPNMSTAKIASDFDKPEGLVVVPPGTVREFLGPLPTEEVHGVGPVTARTLASMGIETAGDLAEADVTELEAELGERGRELYERARGEDDREVTPTGLPKSLSRSSSLPATDDEERKRSTITALAADVSRRAKERDCLYRTIGITVIRPPYDVNTRAKSLTGPVDDTEVVEEVALELLEEFEGEQVRKLGVTVSNLDFDDSDQATLGGFDGEEGEVRERDADANTVDGEQLTDWVESDADSGDERERGRRRNRDGQKSLEEFE